MPDTSSKTMEFKVGIDGNDFQSLMDRLRQLEQAAKKVADSFASIRVGTSGVAGVGGAPMAGVPTAATVASGMGAAGDPEINRIQLLKRSYEELTSALSRYRSERDILGRASGGTGSAAPTPAGILDASGRVVRPLDTMSVASSTGSARGPSYNALEAQIVNINAQTVNINGPVSGGGGDGGGAGGGTGGGTAPDGTPQGRGARVGGFQRSVAALQMGFAAAEAGVDVYKYGTFAGLRNQGGQQVLNAHLLQSMLGGNIAPFMAMREMGGYDAIKDQYGLSGANTLSTYMRLGSGLTSVVGGIGGMLAGGVAGAAIGSAVPIVGTAIGGLVGALGGGMFGSMVSGGVSKTGYAAVDLMTGRVAAQEQQDMLEAIQDYQKTKPFEYMGLEMYSQKAERILGSTRSLSRTTYGGMGGRQMAQDVAAQYNIDPERAVDLAIQVARLAPKGLQQTLAGLAGMEQMEYDSSARQAVLRTISMQQLRVGSIGQGALDPLNMMGIIRYAQTGRSENVVMGAGGMPIVAPTGPSRMGIEEFTAQSISSRYMGRFGTMSDQEMANYSAMVGAGSGSVIESQMREQGLRGFEAASSQALPQMMALEHIKNRFGYLRPYQMMALSQLDPVSLRSDEKLIRLGVKPGDVEAFRSSVSSIKLESTLGFGIDTGSVVGKAVKAAGGLAAFLPTSTKAQREQLAIMTSVSRGETMGDIEPTMGLFSALSQGKVSAKDLKDRRIVPEEGGDVDAAETVRASRAAGVELERRVPEFAKNIGGVMREAANSLLGASTRIDGYVNTFTGTSTAKPRKIGGK
jgi:hypothetical protein